ncbi:Oidioi.mRNA.OKI2018_I69.chr1.g1226.t1.cds [Oikopleura dioica]|uniref:Protein-tyrosine sulfotransferase n=1 Tax=Oikopleura dioica TaxID=34765 RepID=A0ABN7SNZ5_OIKDI|nr:Oidioi.mRNA.OKI2018_I69.chr1.g1226.t1.cds [Oikopleura dioica]
MMKNDSNNKKLLPLFLALLAIFLFDRVFEKCKVAVYDRETPIVFVGGVKGSGTEYIRDLLNTSKDINCQKSTIGSPALLWMAFNELRREKEMKRLHLAGISEELMFKATGEGILEIVFGTRQAKIPFANALINDRENIYQTDANPPVLKLSRFRDGLVYWNETVTVVDEYCKKYQKRCLTIEYENLLDHSNAIARKIGKFLKTDLDKSWKPNPLKTFSPKNRGASKELKKVLQTYGKELTNRAFFQLANFGWEDNLKYEENFESFEKPNAEMTKKEKEIVKELVENVNLDRYQNILKLSNYEKLIRFYRNL